MCKSKMCVIAFIAVLTLVAGLLMGFSGSDNGSSSLPSSSVQALGGPTGMPVSAVDGETGGGLASREHLQTYVYWPLWRSGS